MGNPKNPKMEVLYITVPYFWPYLAIFGGDIPWYSFTMAIEMKAAIDFQGLSQWLSG